MLLGKEIDVEGMEVIDSGVKKFLREIMDKRRRT